MQTNPEKDQDRVTDLFGIYNAHNYTMFPQQRAIYSRLVPEVHGKTVLEAGCGVGLGTAILSRSARYIVGTDKILRNVHFAAELYPWIEWGTWDLNQPTHRKAQVVVCVEAIEHVASLRDAIQHLLAATQEVLWISTPNGNTKPRPPYNQHHVCEYTPQEILDVIGPMYSVVILDWDKWHPVDTNVMPTDGRGTDVLVYRIARP